MSFKLTVIPIIFVPTTTEPLTIKPPAYQMDPILEYFAKVAPVVLVMGLWIRSQKTEIKALKDLMAQANATIEKQNQDYKLLLEKIVENNTTVLQTTENIPATLRQELKNLKNFIELKIAESKKEK